MRPPKVSKVLPALYVPREASSASQQHVSDVREMLIPKILARAPSGIVGEDHCFMKQEGVFKVSKMDVLAS